MEKEKESVHLALDPALQDQLRALVERAGFRPVAVHALPETAARAGEAGALLLDVAHPGLDAREALRRLRSSRPDLPVVIVAAQGLSPAAQECLEAGAADFLQRPFEVERVRQVLRGALRIRDLERALRALREDLWATRGFSRIVGRSARMQEVFRLMGRVVETDTPVLLLGECGTGKEVAARALHEAGPRRDGPYVAVDVGVIDETRRGEEIFGSSPEAPAGRLADARGGTLFLNGVADLPPGAQERLVSALDRGPIAAPPRGARDAVRLIAAEGRDLRREASSGRFRADLLDRLSRFQITLPRLRERAGDVTLLAAHFLREACRRTGRTLQGFEPEALHALEAHPWPGNLRELVNVVERAVLLETGPRIGPASLPEDLRRTRAREAGDLPAADGILSFEDEERRIIERALHLTGGNIMEASHRLGLSRATLYRKIKHYGLRRTPGEVAAHRTA